MSEGQSNRVSVPVWDGYIRIFHWALVIAIITSIVSVRMDKMDIHFISGHVVLALLIFRIIWGLIGSRTALFISFIKGPGTILKYLTKPDSDEFKPMIGHSPVAALSVIAMIVVIGFQVATGLVSDDEILLQGPLAKYVSGEVSYQATGLHAINAKLIVALIVLHLAAIAFYYFVRKDNLVGPMVSGKKPMDEELAARAPDAKRKGIVLAGVAIIISIATAYFVFNA